MSKKIILITGASRGIGKGIALSLGKANKDAVILGTATSDSGAENITQYLQEAGIEGNGFALNVCDANAIDELVKKIEAEYGAITVLVNNAGITRDNLFLRMKPEQWDDVIQTNLTGVFRMIKACLKGMVKARCGRIINISSVVGVTGNPGQANYVAAKAGLIGMTKSLAAEVASRGITVNSVAPGFIETDMTSALTDAQKDSILSVVPMKRMGDVDDIAQCVNYLASDGAAYVTGQTLHVNGGMCMV